MKRQIRAALTGAIVLTLLAASAFASAAEADKPPVSLTPEVQRLLDDKGDRQVQLFVSFDRALPGAVAHSMLAKHGLVTNLDLPSINAVLASGPVKAFRALAEKPGVLALEENRSYEMFDTYAKWSTTVEQVQRSIGGGPYRDADGNVIDGSGVGVAIVDTGVTGSHPDLQSQMARNVKVICTGRSPTNGSACNGWEMIEREDSDTSSGHGTHVAGIVAGDGTASGGLFGGVAPGAKIYGFGAGDGDSILLAEAAASFQWIIQNHDQVDPPIRVVNNSWGGAGEFNPGAVLSQLTTQMVQEGVTVTWAAGNDGGTGTANNVGDLAQNPTPGVIAVANYDDGNTGNRNNQLNSGSSRGRNGDPRTYPDVSAPGTGIVATCKSGLAVCAPYNLHAPHYSSLTGTSMAAPHTAGVVALLLQARPELTPAQVEDVLEDNAHKFTAGAPYGPDAPTGNADDTTSFDKGHGLLDLRATLDSYGTARDGVGNATANVAITSPAGGSTVGTTFTVGGTASVDSIDLSSVTLSGADEAGDAGDVPGSFDLTSFSLSQGATGLTYRFSLADVTDNPPPLASIEIRQNVNGGVRNTTFTYDLGTVTADAPASFNQAPATSVTQNGNDVEAFVPWANLGNPPANSVAHNAKLFLFAPVSPSDYAPGGDGAEANTFPALEGVYTVRPTAEPATVTVKAALADGSPVNATIAPSGPGYTWSADLDATALAEGAHAVTATVLVNGVPRNTDTASFVVDHGLQAPVILTPAAGALLNDQTVTVSGTSSPGASVDVREAAVSVGTAIADGAGAWSVDVTFADGPHTIDAVATLGAETSDVSAARSFSIDTVAPGTPVIVLPVEGASLNSATVAFSGTAEPNTIVTLQEGATTVGSAVTDGLGGWSTNATLGAGAHSVVAIAADPAGNASPASLARSFTIVLPGPAAPIIDTPAEGATLSSTFVNFLGRGTVGSTVTVREGATTIGTAVVQSNGRWVLSRSMSAGAHVVNATTTTAADGEGSPSADRTFTIVPDVTAPDKPVITSPVADSLHGPKVTVTGTAEPKSTVKIYDGTRHATSTVASTSGAFSGVVTLTSGAKTITVKAVDAAGNVSEASDPVAITVDATKPSVAIDTEDGTVFTPGTLAIAGTATDNTGVTSVTVEVYNAFNTKVGTFTATLAAPGEGTTGWTVEPTGLAPGRYRFSAKASDVVNLVSNSASKYAVTLG